MHAVVFGTTELAHCAFHSQKETVIRVQWIVDAVLIAQERVEDAAYINELVPVLVRTRQSAQFQAEHHSHMIETDLRHQSLEAGTLVGGLARQALIVVDDDDAIRRPPQSLGKLCQCVLSLTRLAVLQYLLWR